MEKKDLKERCFFFASSDIPMKPMKLKVVTITAKEKVCVLESPDCNPEKKTYSLSFSLRKKRRR